MLIQNFFLIIGITFLLFGCNKSDEEENLCDAYTPIQEVTIDARVTIIEDSISGNFYIVEAQVINNTNQTQYGYPIIIVNIFDEQSKFGFLLQCEEISALDTCEMRSEAQAVGDVDQNASIDCANFVLY
jgi:hypothetical protein